MMDMTNKIAADDARTNTALRYRDIVEAMAEGVVVYNHELSAILCNKAAEDILGGSEAQLCEPLPLDPTWHLLAIDGSHLAREEYPSTIAIRSGLPCLARHLVVIRADGSKRNVSINAMPMESASLGGLGALVTITDRTNELEAATALQSLALTLKDEVQQRTEEREEAISELKAFSRSISHDLRAPLRAIDGFAQLLNEHHGSELSVEAQRHLDRVLLSAKRMNTIIDDLLLLSQVTQADLLFTKVDISSIAWRVIETLNAGASRHVDWQIERGIMVYGDTSLLTVLIENLLGNAWKYSAKSRDVHISLRAVESANSESITFVVEDNGVGFDQRYVGQLFSPFRRLHPESEFPGSGIGLAAVKRVVSRHGGTVHAEGKIGQGAKFWVSLPRLAKHPTLPL
jgi:PAS domain S-box-containing protein